MVVLKHQKYKYPVFSKLQSRNRSGSAPPPTYDILIPLTLISPISSLASLAMGIIYK